MNSTFYTIKTPEEVREEFRRRGETFADWARRNDISLNTVYALMRGSSKGKRIRSEAHRAAVLLGLKEGTIEERAAS